MAERPFRDASASWRRHRMMLVHDTPLTVDAAQADRQPEQETSLLRRSTGGRRTAPHDGGRESHVLSGRDRDLFHIEGLTGLVVFEKQVPRRLVLWQAARLERRRDIEHEDVGIVIRENRLEIVPAHGRCPSLDERSNLALGLLVVSGHPKSVHPAAS